MPLSAPGGTDKYPNVHLPFQRRYELNYNGNPLTVCPQVYHLKRKAILPTDTSKHGTYLSHSTTYVYGQTQAAVLNIVHGGFAHRWRPNASLSAHSTERLVLPPLTGRDENDAACSLPETRCSIDEQTDDIVNWYVRIRDGPATRSVGTFAGVSQATESDAAGHLSIDFIYCTSSSIPIFLRRSMVERVFRIARSGRTFDAVE